MDSLNDDLKALIGDPLAFLGEERVEMRRMAASILGERSNEKTVAVALASLLGSDPEVSVRAAAAEALAASSDPAPLLAAGDDDATEVREAVAFALGEIGEADALPWLMGTATEDSDDGAREAAVAALGAIGDNTSLPLLVELSSAAPPKVRRRAVVALSAFESADALAAIQAALEDRNPMVKEVAEMVAGGGADDLLWPTRLPSGD
ncbi:MAG: HEAT repeat domain-containing protein [Acidimicrobiia bacterium]